ncbi:10 kDa chaperonin [Striga asiatica]|uniref:10 kDa chaperonin n=1 Tax=Striga asiatica TaxID=4170 RepID=A0A5A7QV91_STRAF|nr:10 kDa chaperonin [Striga asiatica]
MKKRAVRRTRIVRAIEESKCVAGSNGLLPAAAEEEEEEGDPLLTGWKVGSTPSAAAAAAVVGERKLEVSVMFPDLESWSSLLLCNNISCVGFIFTQSSPEEDKRDF